MVRTANLLGSVLVLMVAGCASTALPAGGTLPDSGAPTDQLVVADQSAMTDSLSPIDAATPGDIDAPDLGFCPGAACETDFHCTGGLETCQSGICCSGKLDVGTCICRCNGGAVCRPSERCCPGRKNRPWLPDLGALICRPQTDC